MSLADRSDPFWGVKAKKPRTERGKCDHVWSGLVIRVAMPVQGRPRRRVTASAEQTCSICHGTRKSTVEEPIKASDTQEVTVVRAAGNVILRHLSMGPSQGWQRRSVR